MPCIIILTRELIITVLGVVNFVLGVVIMRCDLASVILKPGKYLTTCGVRYGVQS